MNTHASSARHVAGHLDDNTLPADRGNGRTMAATLASPSSRSSSLAVGSSSFDACRCTEPHRQRPKQSHADPPRHTDEWMRRCLKRDSRNEAKTRQSGLTQSEEEIVCNTHVCLSNWSGHAPEDRELCADLSVFGKQKLQDSPKPFESCKACKVGLWSQGLRERSGVFKIAGLRRAPSKR